MFDAFIREGWNGSGGNCECEMLHHDHTGRCDRKLIFENRGSSEDGGWVPIIRKRRSEDFDSAGQILQIICKRCHQMEIKLVREGYKQ